MQIISFRDDTQQWPICREHLFRLASATRFSLPGGPPQPWAPIVVTTFHPTSNGPVHTHTHTHTHTYDTAAVTLSLSHTHACWYFYGLQGLSIRVMVFIMYKLYVLLPYAYTTPKRSPHRKLHFYITTVGLQILFLTKRCRGKGA